jgi:hypothetical protein
LKIIVIPVYKEGDITIYSSLFEEKLVILAYVMLNFSLSFKISTGEKMKM